MSPELERQLLFLERQRETLLKRIGGLKTVNEKNEAFRKLNILDDEMARIQTPNAI